MDDANRYEANDAKAQGFSSSDQPYLRSDALVVMRHGGVTARSTGGRVRPTWGTAGGPPPRSGARRRRAASGETPTNPAAEDASNGGAEGAAGEDHGPAGWITMRRGRAAGRSTPGAGRPRRRTARGNGGSGLHHAALHGREDELRECGAVQLRGPSVSRGLQAVLDGGDPVVEVGGEALADGRIRLVELERQAADRAAVGAVGLDEEPPVAAQQGEDPLGGVKRGKRCPVWTWTCPAASCI